MKATELLNKNTDELKAELIASFKELFNLRMQKGAGQLPKGNVIKTVRRSIARIKTVLKQKGVSV